MSDVSAETVASLKDEAEISDVMTCEELETQAAVTWDELAYERDANRHLREMCAEMFDELRRIHNTRGVMRMGNAPTSRQMARWYSECMRWGVEVY